MGNWLAVGFDIVNLATFWCGDGQNDASRSGELVRVLTEYQRRGRGQVNLGI